MNKVSLSSLSNLNEIDNATRHLTLTPMSKTVILGKFNHKPWNKKYDLDKFRKEQESLFEKYYHQKLLLAKRLNGSSPNDDIMSNEARLDMEQQNNLLNLRMRIGELKPSIDRLYDPYSKLVEVNRFKSSVDD